MRSNIYVYVKYSALASHFKILTCCLRLLSTRCLYFAVLYFSFRYLVSAQYITNSFLDSQGLPKSTHLNMNNPEKSISTLTNYVLKTYLDMDTDVSEYVKPAIAYIKVQFCYYWLVARFLSYKQDIILILINYFFFSTTE